MQDVLINGNNTKMYGVKVRKIKGAFDMPGRFGTYHRDWKDTDGVEAFVEQNDLYFKQRKITLDCILEADDIGFFQQQMGFFRELIYQKVSIQTPYSLHECILKDNAKVKFINDKYGNNVIAEFSLVFNEISYNFGETLIPDENVSNSFFWIDKIKLSRFGIVVESSDGFLDFPKMKTDNITRYLRESDRVNKRGARNISLKCSLFADNIIDLSTKFAQFNSLLAAEGLRKLMLPIEGLEKPFEVFAANGYKVTNIIQNDNQIVASFIIIFEEPEPKIETINLTILLDTNGDPILTTSGEFIYIVADRTTNENKDTYLFTDEEVGDNTYLWTTEELDDTDPNYNEESKEIYLFTNEELEE